MKSKKEFIFSKANYKLMLIGFVVIALGFILMVGGGSDDPNVFNPEIFNFRRIRLAPALVLIGFGIERIRSSRPCKDTTGISIKNGRRLYFIAVSNCKFFWYDYPLTRIIHNSYSL